MTIINMQQLLQEAVSKQWSIGVCALIVDESNEVLLVQRAPSDWCAGVWEMPGGGKEKEEDLIACLTREVKEETGLTIIGEPELIGYFDFKHSESSATKRKFCFRITHVSGIVKISADHSNAKYFSLAQIQTLKLEGTANPYELFRDHYQLLVKNLT